MNGKQRPAGFDAAFETLGLVFGNPEPHQRANDAARRANRPRTRQHCDDWTRGDERPNARNCQRADAGQPANDAAHHCSRGNAGCSAFRRLGVLLMNKILGARIFRQQDGDIGVAEAGGRKASRPLLNPTVSRYTPNTAVLLMIFSPRAECSL